MSEKKSPLIDVLSITSSILSIAGVSLLSVIAAYKLDNKAIAAACIVALIGIAGLFFLILFVDRFIFWIQKKGKLRTTSKYIILTGCFLIILILCWYYIALSRLYFFRIIYENLGI